LIHGDLLNNVLFDDDLPPAVIDVSPFWRPARYADAIIIVDAIGWYGARRSAIEALHDPAGVQLLIRATLFRLGSAACSSRTNRIGWTENSWRTRGSCRPSSPEAAAARTARRSA
jgi:hypothetical protein